MLNKKKLSAALFSTILMLMPAMAVLSDSLSNAYAIAGIWAGGTEGKVLGTIGVAVEVGAGAAFALGAICPPQFVGLAVIGG